MVISKIAESHPIDNCESSEETLETFRIRSMAPSYQKSSPVTKAIASSQIKKFIFVMKIPRD